MLTTRPVAETDRRPNRAGHANTPDAPRSFRGLVLRWKLLLQALLNRQAVRGHVHLQGCNVLPGLGLRLFDGRRLAGLGLVVGLVGCEQSDNFGNLDDAGAPETLTCMETVDCVRSECGDALAAYAADQQARNTCGGACQADRTTCSDSCWRTCEVRGSCDYNSCMDDCDMVHSMCLAACPVADISPLGDCVSSHCGVTWGESAPPDDAPVGNQHGVQTAINCAVYGDQGDDCTMLLDTCESMDAS